MNTQDPNRPLSSQLPEDLIADEPAAPYGGPAPAPAPAPVPAQPPVTEVQREPAPAQSGGLSAGVWAAIILGALILVLLLVFIVQNNEPTQFYYFGWTFNLPLGVSILAAAIIGIVISGIVGSIRMFVLKRRLKQARKN